MSARPRSDEDEQTQRFRTYVVPELDLLYRVALSMTRNPADAEDLTQDTLMRAFRAIGRFDGRYPRAWLLTILRNSQANRVRRRRPQLVDDPDALSGQVQAVGDTSAEGLVVGELFDAVVEDAFRALPGAFRAAVALVDINGLSYQEAADTLGIPVGTIMSRLHRARKRIRARLGAAGVAPRTAR